MQTKESAEITRRFFEALNKLIQLKVIRGKKTFTERYGINRWNLNALEKGQSTQNSVQLDWLTFIVRDYGISARWLLTGEGEMFARKAANKENKVANENGTMRPQTAIDKANKSAEIANEPANKKP